jgi:MFS family permease
MNFSLQMVEVAIGWEVYAQHRSALDLGWIGLVEFIPMFGLALPAGHLADRLPRRLVFGTSLVLSASVGGGLAAVSGSGVTSIFPYLGLAFAAGTALAVGSPSARAMSPTLVPEELVPSAMTLRTIGSQTAQVLGPALGGLLYGMSAVLVYGLAGAVALAAAACVFAMRPRPAVQTWRDSSGSRGNVNDVVEGLRFVGATPILLGSILLDLLAVLFGGAVALLPIFARSVLHVGSTGLGVLRAAPALGSLLAATVITRRPPSTRAGRTLLTVVALYGASIVVFGLSRVFPLSLLALGFSGFVDLYSMNIRTLAVALATPDHLRGRIMAVEMVFISASNELGAFESGLAASLLGAVPAVVVGGLITITIALCWPRFFPGLARIDRLAELRPADG